MYVLCCNCLSLDSTLQFKARPAGDPKPSVFEHHEYMEFRYGELKLVDSPAPAPTTKNDTCGTVKEDDVLELKCPSGHKITQVGELLLLMRMCEKNKANRKYNAQGRQAVQTPNALGSFVLHALSRLPSQATGHLQGTVCRASRKTQRAMHPKQQTTFRRCA